jgi:hypothetical protein
VSPVFDVFFHGGLQCGWKHLLEEISEAVELVTRNGDVERVNVIQANALKKISSLTFLQPIL